MERRRLFALATFALTVAVIAVLVLLARRQLDPERAGRHVNERAWIATYAERGAEAPPGGPRDGYWQDAIPKRRVDPDVGWLENPVDLPGRIAIDEQGRQHYRSRHPDACTLLVLGGSVAFGAYASSEQTTWFHRLGERLDEDPRTACNVIVLASIAWKSSQELAALVRRTDDLELDWVVAVDGLNDVTNGSNAKALYTQETETLDGRPWTVTYHEHDYLDRAVEYANNVAKMHAVATDRGARLMVVLQPALFERDPMTAIEADLFERVRERFGSRGHLLEAYTAMRRGLELIARQSDTEVIDASRLFADEAQTSFTDLWHFADHGHARLADAIAERLVPLRRAQAAESAGADG